ncbi:MAG: putative drug exporter of the superfamily [Bacilli bacterium]|nr:putative drug exporter of the superfamily [Bacilli bacterium]
MRDAATKGWFWRFGQNMYKYRWFVLIVWLVLMVLFVPLAKKTPGLLKDTGFTPEGSESNVGFRQLSEQLDFPASQLNLVYTSEKLDLTKEKQKKIIIDSLDELKKLPYFKEIAFGAASRSAGQQGVQMVVVSLNLDTEQALEHYPEMRRAVKPPQGMNLYVNGGTAILYDMQQASKSDIMKSDIIGLPVALLVLLIVFGTLVGAALPMIIGVMSVTMTLGISYFIAREYSLSNFLPNIVTMLGLAIGIDYALLMVSRFREELKRQDTVQDAVAMTCQTAGKSIFYSGIAVVIGLFGMLFINLKFFHSLCIGGVLVVSVSVLVANTLLLALLGLLGPRINSLRVIPKVIRDKGPSKLWNKIAFGVMKRPVVLILVIGSGLVVMMTPVTRMNLGVPNAEVLPPSYESRFGSDVMKKTYDSREMNPIQIVVQTEGEVWKEDSIRKVRLFAEKVQQTAGVKSIKSYVNGLGSYSDKGLAALFHEGQLMRKMEQQKLAKGHTALLVVVPETDSEDQVTDLLVRRLRRLDLDGLQANITGGPAHRVDIIDRIQDQMVKVLVFIMGITYVVLLFAFRSVLLPLKAVLMNVLSLGASLGVVVKVFQDGYLANVFHITSIGYVNATLPISIFCIVFGISMDYEVFLISRIMEEYRRSGDNEHSTALGLTKTGGLITSAAFILVVVVGSFIFTDIEIMKGIGLGLALAVLIDATIIRIIIVPALMKLLGKANWWAPKWLRLVKGG